MNRRAKNDRLIIWILVKLALKSKGQSDSLDSYGAVEALFVNL